MNLNVAAARWRVDEADEARRQARAHAILQVAVGGFIAGHSCLFNEWLHFGWLLFAGLTAAVFVDWRPVMRLIAGDAAAWLCVAFLFWMTARSCVVASADPEAARADMERGLAGLGFLVLLLGLIWAQSRWRDPRQVIAQSFGSISFAAAVISMALFYGLLPNHSVGERLMNVLVYGGLNAVCTGLIFGCAVIWLTCRWLEPGRPRLLAMSMTAVLTAATLFTSSRGALMALVCAHGVLLLTLGLRKAFPALALCAAVVGLYMVSAPLVIKAAEWQRVARQGPQAAVVAAEIAAQTAHPVAEALARGDNGRLNIYRAGLSTLTTPWLRVAGIGQWGTRDLWHSKLGRDPLGMRNHLHSSFVATCVNGGLIGLLLLLLLLACGSWRAFLLARMGEPMWAVLLAYGVAGLLFDGETFTSLASAPRFEGLLFWVPLMFASARYAWVRREAADTAALAE